jgi:negative regulator of sigma E activity
MDEPHKKSSPFPIAKATDQEVAPRPVSPVRKLALPIGVAAAMLLAGSAGAYAYASAKGSADHEGDGCPTRAHAGGDFITRTVDKVKGLIDPEPAPRMAGEMVAPTSVPVVPASGSSSANPPPPPPPDPNPPPLPGKIAPPHVNDANTPGGAPNGTTQTSTSPAGAPATTPKAPPPGPAPDHPKLGGKPVAPKNPQAPGF